MAFLVILCTILLIHDTQAILRFASPLQALTIWDKSVVGGLSPRDTFLLKYKAGLQAEQETREALNQRHEEFMNQQDKESKDWPKRAAAIERRRKIREEALIEKAYNEAINSMEATTPSTVCTPKDTNEYQFVGVVNKGSPAKTITWYAKKKPTESRWSMRLVHVNKDSIIKDLFNRGKVDIVARYTNPGTCEETKKRIIHSDYEVKERSWRCVWNGRCSDPPSHTKLFSPFIVKL